MAKRLGEFEQLLLFAVLRLDADAYGARIASEITRRTGRSVSPGAVYTVLDRLESAGLVSSHLAPGPSSRGGRRKKFYRLEPAGGVALHQSWSEIQRMARGVVDELQAFVRDEDPVEGA